MEDGNGIKHAITKTMEPEKLQQAIDQAKKSVKNLTADKSRGLTVIYSTDNGWDMVSYMEAKDLAEAIYTLLKKEPHIMEAFTDILKMATLASMVDDAKAGNFFQMTDKPGNA